MRQTDREYQTWWCVEKLHRLPGELELTPRELARAMADWSAAQGRINDEQERQTKAARDKAKARR